MKRIVYNFLHKYLMEISLNISIKTVYIPISNFEKNDKKRKIIYRDWKYI